MITPSSFDRIGRINQSRGYGEKMDGLREAVLEMMRDVAEIGVQAAEVILREVPELRDASAEIQAAIRTVPGPNCWPASTPWCALCPGKR